MVDLDTKLNKEEFIKFVSKKKGVTQREVEQAINLFTYGIKSALAEGKRVTLVGFAVFYTQRREARDGVNPKTRQKIHIPAYNQVMCRFGSLIKKACNNA